MVMATLTHWFRFPEDFQSSVSCRRGMHEVAAHLMMTVRFDDASRQDLTQEDQKQRRREKMVLEYNDAWTSCRVPSTSLTA